MMTHDEVFESLKNYIETRPAPRWALGLLNPGVEIGLTIGNYIDCAILNAVGVPSVEKREAKNPSFIFHMRPETIETLANSKSDDTSEIVRNVMTQIMTGNIRVEVKGSFKDILADGYGEILKNGGQKAQEFVTTQGSMGLMKVLAFIDKLKNSKPT